MGGAFSGFQEEGEAVSEPVIIHCYDYFTSGEGQAFNGVLRALGTGAFHVGVEVYGVEWSFRGRTVPGCGIFAVEPRTACPTYREAIPMGTTALPAREVERIIETMTFQWPGQRYDILKRNCCHFCEEFCIRLGVGRLPEFITHLADAGSALEDDLATFKKTMSGVMKADGCVRHSSKARALRAADGGSGYKQVGNDGGSPPESPVQAGRLGKCVAGEEVQYLSDPKDEESCCSSSCCCYCCCPCCASSSQNSPARIARGRLHLVNLCTILLMSVLAGLLTAIGIAWAMARYRAQHAGSHLDQSSEDVHEFRVSYDCQTDLAHWRTHWSDEKADWCCRNEDLACPYDCLDGYATASNHWSPAKSDWCCSHARLGCSNVASDRKLPDVEIVQLKAPNGKAKRADSTQQQQQQQQQHKQQAPAQSSITGGGSSSRSSSAASPTRPSSLSPSFPSSRAALRRQAAAREAARSRARERAAREGAAAAVREAEGRAEALAEEKRREARREESRKKKEGGEKEEVEKDVLEGFPLLPAYAKTPLGVEA